MKNAWSLIRPPSSASTAQINPSGSIRLAVLFASLALAACIEPGEQVADVEWVPEIANPSYPMGEGPVVLVDAAHGNYHTIDGSFTSFASLLTADGYAVHSADEPVSRELLDRADVFVISNPELDGEDAAWTLPTPAAFTPGEINVIEQWVSEGGSLLLIADHMPFPGGVEKLADAFGVIFLNGFALPNTEDSALLTFTRSENSLAEHTITRGHSDDESIESVMTFTGQAFRAVSDVQALMLMPDDWIVVLPIEAWEFDDDTPRVSARGLMQGGVLHHGSGKVAVFGEAAMFTAQVYFHEDELFRMGLNHPDAGQNAQFVLNVLHWLSGLLDEAA